MTNVLKVLKGGSLSNTEVLIDGRTKFVRKSISFSENREFGLVRWQSQVRKLQLLNKFIPELTVPILRMGILDHCYFYDLPYYESHLNCAEALLAGEPVDDIAEKISELLSRMASIKYGPSRGSLSVYVAEEVRTPLEMALKLVMENRLPLNKYELEIFDEALHRSISYVDKFSNNISDITLRESLNHGNLTLENLLWDPRAKNIMMIDPYAETYCDAIMGDVSQLSQSSEYGYEFISDLFNKQDFEINNYPYKKIPHCFTHFYERLYEIIAKENWYSGDYLGILKASQFIRMFPFKLMKSPRQGVAFMMLGMHLLENA